MTITKADIFNNDDSVEVKIGPITVVISHVIDDVVTVEAFPQNGASLRAFALTFQEAEQANQEQVEWATIQARDSAFYTGNGEP